LRCASGAVVESRVASAIGGGFGSPMVPAAPAGRAAMPNTIAVSTPPAIDRAAWRLLIFGMGLIIAVRLPPGNPRLDNDSFV
jgi:hypothetical protein